MFLLKSLVAVVGVTFLVTVGLSRGSLKVISPEKGAVWWEGQTYSIRWKGGGDGNICISVLLGGKDKGIINDCHTPGAAGSYSWFIPRGFVTGFGISREDGARVCLFYPGTPSRYVCSPYFTIAGVLKE